MKNVLLYFDDAQSDVIRNQVSDDVGIYGLYTLVNEFPQESILKDTSLIIIRVYSNKFDYTYNQLYGNTHKLIDRAYKDNIPLLFIYKRVVIDRYSYYTVRKIENTMHLDAGSIHLGAFLKDLEQKELVLEGKAVYEHEIVAILDKSISNDDELLLLVAHL